MTLLSGLLAVSAGHDVPGVALVAVAVLAGQLSIGWSNDLADAGRDRAVGRGDKPLAADAVSERTVRVAIAVAVGACIGLSAALGLAAGAVHLVLVGFGWAYNLGLKRTVWSWLPFASAFGGLPVVVTLALGSPALPPGWMPLAGALLGVGAHLVNVLPDLDDDAVTGVRGIGHRLGHRRAQLLAISVLCTASVVTVVGPSGTVPAWSWAGLVVVAALAAGGLFSAGRTPFRAAVGIAVVDVVMLVLRG